MGVFDLFKKKSVQKTEKKENIEDKRANLLKDCLAYERDYLAQNKNTTYDFFGYIMDPEDEIPFFVEASTKRNSGEFEFSNSVTPVTPKMLKHCVTHLTHDAMVSESKNVPGFIKKAYQIAHHFDVVSKDEWDKIISELVNYIQKPHHFSEEQLRQIVSCLTEEQLREINWVEFGKLLKKFEVLPPSYFPSADVQVGAGKDGVPKTKLTFKSGTSPSVRTLIIRRGDVTHLVNGADNGQPDAKASKVWKDFCGKNFGFMLNQENKQPQK